MKKILVSLLLMSLTTLSWAEGDRDKVLDRVTEAGNVMNEIMSAPDAGIPDEILGSAECVAVVPSMLKGGKRASTSFSFEPNLAFTVCSALCVMAAGL